jgi:hypothetical protein
MGKKRPPLRKIFASSRGAKSKSSKCSAAEDDDELDWEVLEKQQRGQDCDEEDEGDDEDEDSDSGGIRLDSNIEHVMEEFTFEFNDMREEYAEGVCMMLRKMVVNPTEAYSLASLVTRQSECDVRCALYAVRRALYAVRCDLCAERCCEI